MKRKIVCVWCGSRAARRRGDAFLCGDPRCAQGYHRAGGSNPDELRATAGTLYREAEDLAARAARLQARALALERVDAFAPDGSWR